MGTSGPESFETAARRLIQRYVDAILRSDADGIRELWDDGAIAMPPDTPMVVGKRAIGEMFQSAFERVSYERFDIDLPPEPEGQRSISRGRTWRSGGSRPTAPGSSCTTSSARSHRSHKVGAKKV